MALRMIEMVVPLDYKQNAENLIAEQKILDVWQETVSEGRLHVQILLNTEQTEPVLDLLEKKFSHVDGFRIILLPVEASIPRPKQDKVTEGKEEGKEAEKRKAAKTRISREELYTDVEQTTRYSWVFIVLMVLSSVVASIGILRDNVVVIIGAMVIAPALGPNVALSLATTLGDIDLSRRAVKVISVAIFVALGVSVLLGIFLKVDPGLHELRIRTEVNLGDIALALAAGSAAVLSFTSGLLSALIGVMVAVALLPPLVTLGLLAGSGQWRMALGALLLFMANLICVNLAGVVTFLVQGIRPLSWWEANKAKKAVRRAIFLWIVLLTALVASILLSQKG